MALRTVCGSGVYSQCRCPAGPYSFLWLRFSDPQTGQAFLLVANLHADRKFENVHVRVPKMVIDALGTGPNSTWTVRLGEEDMRVSTDLAGVTIPEIRPLTPLFFELKRGE